jgi:hypothetical protein
MDILRIALPLFVGDDKLIQCRSRGASERHSFFNTDDTKLESRLLGLADATAQELAQAMLQQIPAAFRQAGEVATDVAFLASDDAFITGVELAVDCGRTQL